MAEQVQTLQQFMDKYYPNQTQQQNNSSAVDKSVFNKSQNNSNSTSSYSISSIISGTDETDNLFADTFPLARKKSNNFTVQGNDTQDGKITGTYQRGTGDCWLLSGINALASTKDGAKIIAESLDYQENGDVIVHLKGAGDYTVYKSEIDAIKNQQSKGSAQYSVGDDDMLILEIAVEKVFDDIAAKKIKWADGTPQEFETQQELMADLQNYKNSITGGQITQLMYLLTGKKTEHLNDKASMEAALNDKQMKDVALGAAMHSDKVVKDVNGNNVQLYGLHAYSIKNVTGDTVTVINPWDSNEEITLSRSTFMQAFEHISKCDLTDDNKDVNYIIRPDSVDGAGNKTYYFSSEEFDGGKYRINVDGKEVEAHNRKEVYDDKGNLVEIVYYDEDGNILLEEKYDVQNKQENNNDSVLTAEENPEILDSDKEKSEKVSVIRVGNGDSTYFEIRKYDENGNVSEELYLSHSKLEKTIVDKNLFKENNMSEDMSYDDTKILDKLSKMKWEDFEADFK